MLRRTKIFKLNGTNCTVYFMNFLLIPMHHRFPALVISWPKRVALCRALLANSFKCNNNNNKSNSQQWQQQQRRQFNIQSRHPADPALVPHSFLRMAFAVVAITHPQPQYQGVAAFRPPLPPFHHPPVDQPANRNSSSNGIIRLLFLRRCRQRQNGHHRPALYSQHRRAAAASDSKVSSRNA